MTAALDLDAGDLPHRITIESAAGTADGGGGETLVWDTLATLWAAVEPAAADEKIVAGHLAGVVTHTVTVRWRPDLAGGMRVLHRGRTLRVLTAFDPDETRRCTVLKCAEETP